MMGMAQAPGLPQPQNLQNNNNNVAFTQYSQPQLQQQQVTMTSLVSSNDPTSGYRGPQSFGAGSAIREEWEAKRKASMKQASDKDPRMKKLSGGIGPFHSLTPLDDATRDTTLTFFGYYSPVFRARHSGDGLLYALRALRSYRTPTGMNCCFFREENEVIKYRSDEFDDGMLREMEKCSSSFDSLFKRGVCVGWWSRNGFVYLVCL